MSDGMVTSAVAFFLETVISLVALAEVYFSSPEYAISTVWFPALKLGTVMFAVPLDTETTATSMPSTSKKSYTTYELFKISCNI